MFRRFSILRDKSNDGGSGGAGGDAAPFTEAQLSALGQVVNSAITSHLKRQPNPAEEFKKLLTKETLGPLLTELMGETEGGSGGESAPSGGKGGEKGKGSRASDDPIARQLQELADKLEKSEKRAAAAEQARTDEANARAFDRARGDLRSALQAKVRPEGLEQLVKLLADADKLVKLTDDGAPLMTIKRAPYKGAPEQDEDLPLAEAVPIWLASEPAKFWLPAPGAGGAWPPGSKAPRTPGSGSSGTQLSADPATRTLQQLEAQGLDPSELFD